MAKVTILNEGVSFEVPEGARLLDYIKENSSMPFGCESGTCGICICTVVKGMEDLIPGTMRNGCTSRKGAPSRASDWLARYG